MNLPAFNRGLRVCALIGLAVTMAGLSAGAATVSLGSAPGFPGQAATVPMELNAGTNLPPHVIAMQADVIFDPSRVVSRAPSGGAALRGHRVASREPTNGLRRVVLYSANNTPMTNGTVVRLRFDVTPTNYLNGPLQLTNVVLATAVGGRVGATNFPGVVYLNPVFFAADGTVEGFLRTPSDARYLVQATTDFLHWTTIATNDAIGSVIRFLDTDAASHPQRFYRAVLFDAAGQFGTITQLAGGQIQFSFSGLAGRSYVIEASTNLTHWEAVGTNVAGAGPQFFNQGAPGLPYRFFRLVSQP